MIDKVISTIERYQMLEKGATVIVALSGGADSMALLSVLNTLATNFDLHLLAAHVNHGLRGAEALRDEVFVKDQCKILGIEIKVLKANVKETALNSGEGIEECGRRIRYDFFNSICGNTVIATAHTLSDSMETMLFNLARGATLKGLCSIPPVRDNIIRPLIECTRTEIEAYCSKNNISYVTDSSNLTDDFTRNNIRHNIIPQLKKINPLLENAYLRCSNSLVEDENYLNRETLNLIEAATFENGYDADILLNSHIALRKRALAKILFEKTGTKPENKHIQSVEHLLRNGGNIQILKAVTARVRSGVLLFFDTADKTSSWAVQFQEGFVELPFTSIQIKIVNKADLNNIQNVNNKILDYCFDYDKISSNILIRNRREGDSIRLAKRKCTKSLKKLFNEKGLPPEDRNKVVVICDDEGILFVEGFGCAERCTVCEETHRVCIIIFGRTKNV